MQGDIYGTDDPVNLWLDNSIQFPRFIAEAEAAGVFTPENINDMIASMDITSDEWSEIVDRAQLVWQRICSAQRHPSNGGN